MIDLKKYSNKTKAAFILLIVMIIILLNNFNTLQNSKNTNENINAIYKDRLVAERYIFQYANELYYIKGNSIQTKLNDYQKKEEITAALNSIKEINQQYLKTKLTSNETIVFNKFVATCVIIAQKTQDKNWNQVAFSSNQALQTLDQLSQIQIKEGKSSLSKSNALHDQNSSLGELQIALLVILSAITIYLLMAKKNKITIKIPEAPGLN